MLKITDKLIDEIKKHEGFRSRGYECSEDHLTIGYGTKLPFSREECSILYNKRNGLNNDFISESSLSHNFIKTKDGYKGANNFQAISKDEADLLLRHRLKIKAKEVEKRLKEYPNIDVGSSAICEVLLNMAYQLGTNGLFKFKKMLTALNNQSYKEAIKEMEDSIWHRQTPNRANDLKKKMKEL